MSDDPSKVSLEGQNAILVSVNLYLSASYEAVFVTSETA
jgi:hypothetical protein